jgi:phosphomannomutase
MKKAATAGIISVLLSVLTFCTGCQYLPEALKELGNFKLKESIEIDVEPKQEFPEHCNKNVDAEKL